MTAGGLFGQSLNAIQAKFKLRTKHIETLHCIIPRRNTKPTSMCKPAVQLPLPKRVALSWDLNSSQYSLRTTAKPPTGQPGTRPSNIWEEEDTILALGLTTQGLQGQEDMIAHRQLLPKRHLVCCVQGSSHETLHFPRTVSQAQSTPPPPTHTLCLH